MAGYTRNDTSNNIATGNVINAADLDGEFDALVAAFHASTGHTHDGTAANGAPITKIGPVQDLVISTGAITPKTDNTVDLGSSSFEFKDLYIDGTANIDALVADTADINAGTIDGTAIGANSASTGAFTTLSASSTVTLSGGTANGVLYLNGSKVATSGSALTWDGTNLGVGAAPNNYAGYSLAAIGNTSGGGLQLKTSGAAFTEILASSTEFYQKTVGAATPIWWGINNVEQMRLTSTGLGIGTSSPISRLTVSSNQGGLRLSHGFLTSDFSEVSFSADGIVGSGAAIRSYRANDIFTGNEGDLRFYTNQGTVTSSDNATEKMRLDSAGNLGLGVTPSASWGTAGSAYKVLQYGISGFLAGRTGNEIALLGTGAYSDGTNWRYLLSGNYASYYQQASGVHSWYTAPSGTAGNAITFTQAMTLDASGNLGVGQTSPICRVDIREANRTNSSNISNVGIYTTSSPTTDIGGTISLGGRFNSASQTEAPFGSIRGAKENSTNNNYAGYLAFQTISDSSVLTERARITSGGDLLVGGTSSKQKLTVYGSISAGNSGAGRPSLVFEDSAQTSVSWITQLKTDADQDYYQISIPAETVGVYMTPTASGWNNLSDERLKTDWVELENAIEKINSLRAGTFAWLKDKTLPRDVGLIAQDVQAVLPEAVNSINPDELGLRYTHVVPLLVKAIQEQQALITSLTARVATLEGTQP